MCPGRRGFFGGRRQRPFHRYGEVGRGPAVSKNLGPKALQRFRVRRRDGQYRAPSLSAIRSLLVRVNSAQLDAALRTWHEAHGGGDSALAIDGKTIRGAIDADGNQTHVLGIVGHMLVSRGPTRIIRTNLPWGTAARRLGMERAEVTESEVEP